MSRYKNFSLSDNLKTTEIDLTDYLSKFSDDNYTLTFRNIQPVKAIILNLFEKLTLIDNFTSKGTSFRQYRIFEGELPEDVAIKFYGSEDYWWVIAIFNEIDDILTDWPASEEQLNYLADTLSEKEDKYTRDTYYDLLFDDNEDKRIIDVLKPNQLPALVTQFRNNIVAENASGTQFKVRI